MDDVVFESGALNPDGSIVGNHNDADPLQFEPYYREINSPEQVQIFEPILKDAQGKVTTGTLVGDRISERQPHPAQRLR